MIAGKWVDEEFSSRRHYPNKTEAARIVELRGGRCLWVAWNPSGVESKGDAPTRQAAKDAADAHLNS